MFHTMHVSVMSVMSNEYLLPYAIMKDFCISQALLGGSMNPSTKLNAMAALKEGLVCRQSPQHRLPATRHVARAAAAAPATVNIDSWVEDSRRSREQWLEVTNSFFPPLQQNKSLSSYLWLPIASFMPPCCTSTGVQWFRYTVHLSTLVGWHDVTSLSLSLSQLMLYALHKP